MEKEVVFTMKQVLVGESPGITHTTAKYVLGKMYETGKEAIDIVNEESLWQINDMPTLERIIDQVIKDNPKAVADYRGDR